MLCSRISFHFAVRQVNSPMIVGGSTKHYYQ
nr:MAG TPA: hypothetical protein [Caudoviricetes sp.]